jgi:hypothetical protein
VTQPSNFKKFVGSSLRKLENFFGSIAKSFVWLIIPKQAAHQEKVLLAQTIFG